MAAAEESTQVFPSEDVANPVGLERLLDLIGSIYDASLKASIWPQILASLAPFFDANKGTLISLDPQQPQSAATYAFGFDSVLSPDFRNRDMELDYWCERSKDLPTRSVFLGSELLPVAEMRKSAMYRQFGKPFGVEFMVGGVVSNLPRHLAIIAFYRAERDFEPRAKRLMSLLLPHLQLALFVNRRLGEFVQGQRAAIEVLEQRNTHGIIMLNAGGDVLHANQRAIALGQRGEGITLQKNRVVFRSTVAQGKFDRLIHNASQTVLETGLEGGGFFILPRRGGKAPIEVAVSPVRQSAASVGVPAATTCMAFVHDPADRYEVSGDWLRSVYGLTPAEVRLCDALFNRESLTDAARHLRVTENTARSQLKGVFVKLGVASQSQLMLRLAMSLTLRMAPPKKSRSIRRRKPA